MRRDISKRLVRPEADDEAVSATKKGKRGCSVDRGHGDADACYVAQPAVEQSRFFDLKVSHDTAT